MTTKVTEVLLVRESPEGRQRLMLEARIHKGLIMLDEYSAMVHSVAGIQWEKNRKVCTPSAVPNVVREAMREALVAMMDDARYMAHHIAREQDVWEGEKHDQPVRAGRAEFWEDMRREARG